MSWNPVLDLFTEIKETYIKLYGSNKLWDYQDNNIFSNCLSYWIWHIVNKGHSKRHYYQDIIKPLTINEYNGMILIRYKDLNVDWDAYDGFYNECRSVVIDIYNNTLVLTPFRKFRNINECEENSFKNIQKRIKYAHHVEITDKLDGSMASVRYYNNYIVISGSQALDRERSFRVNNYYNWIWRHDNISQMIKAWPEYTFIFEGIFFNDIHVVRYDPSMEGMHLVGMRHVETGIELSYNDIIMIATKYGVPHVQLFDMTFEEVYQDTINNGRSANEGEGYVVNIDGYKVKVKYNDYVAVHNILGKLISPNAIIRAIHDGNFDDLYSKIPSAYQPQAQKIANNIFTYIDVRESEIFKWFKIAVEQSHFTNDRKEFMIIVNNIVPKQHQGCVRAMWLHQDIDLLINIKYNDVLDYLDFYHTADSN